MKKILKFNLIILSIIFLFFISRIIINIIGITTSNHSIINKLYFININEPYIAYYNNGNIYYIEKDYKKAIIEYKKALNNKPPKNKLCYIKRKIALSKINMSNNTDRIKKDLIKDNCYSNEIKKYISKKVKEKEKYQHNNVNNKSNDNRQLDIEKYENLSRYNYSYNK